MPETRQIISHGIIDARNVFRFGQILEMALMQTVEAEEISDGTVGSGGTFVGPGDSRSIVTKGGNGAIGTIHRLDQYILMGQLSCQFQLTIIDGPLGVVKANKISNNIGRKLFTPEDGLDVAVGGGGEPDATHASTRSIVGPNCDRVIRNNFSKGSGTGNQLVCQLPKVINLVLHGLVNWNRTVGVHTFQRQLQHAKETATARDTNDHAAKFPKDFVPFPEWHRAALVKILEDGSEPFLTMWGEFNGACNSVDEPSQDGFGDTGTGITF